MMISPYRTVVFVITAETLNRTGARESPVAEKQLSEEGTNDDLGPLVLMAVCEIAAE